MPHTVLRPAICANLSLAPASPDCLILRIHIPHLLMAAWTLLQAQLISAKPNRHKTTLAPPCPHWNAVMKICAITEDCTMFCLLPRVRLQVGWGSFCEITLVAFRLVMVRSWRSAVSFVINVNRDSRRRSGWLGAGGASQLSSFYVCVNVRGLSCLSVAFLLKSAVRVRNSMS